MCVYVDIAFISSASDMMRIRPYSCCSSLPLSVCYLASMVMLSLHWYGNKTAQRILLFPRLCTEGRTTGTRFYKVRSLSCHFLCSMFQHGMPIALVTASFLALRVKALRYIDCTCFTYITLINVIFILTNVNLAMPLVCFR